MPFFEDHLSTKLFQHEIDRGEATIVCTIDEPIAACVGLMKLLKIQWLYSQLFMLAAEFHVQPICVQNLVLHQFLH